MTQAEQVMRALSTQEQYAEQLLQFRHVIGVATGYRSRRGRTTSEICVQVFVDRKLPPESLAAADVVPRSLEVAGQSSVGTDVMEITIEAQPPDPGRYRPVPAGCSIGPESSVSAGTLGGWGCDQTDDTIVLLTNNHVISNLDALPALRRIVQPGRLDGGVLPDDVIGSLKRHVVVNTVPNTPGAAPPLSVVDAAIGTIDVDYTPNLLQLNVPVTYEIRTPALAMNVQKRGRTTRLTTNGRITSINATIDISYRSGTRLGRIQNAFIITSTDGSLFSDRGDSGSLILDQVEGELEGAFPVVGLLFGGGTDAGGTPVTIANDINAVFGALNLTTVCTCVARAVIRAVFGAESAEARGDAPVPFDRQIYVHKERQLRRFRDQLRESGVFGEEIDKLIRTQTARVGSVLTHDEQAFGLLVRALRPFVKQPTNLDVLETRLDRDSIDSLLKFAARLSRTAPKMRARIAGAKAIARAVEGATLGQVLRAANLSLERGAKSTRKPGRR